MVDQIDLFDGQCNLGSSAICFTATVMRVAPFEVI
jgi:hypothetical protein